jgi:sugar phosphate isomerase/epimerase
VNRLAVITAFLGGVRNRYLVYQDDRPLVQKLEMAARVEGIEGLELCYPADMEDPDALRQLLDQYGFGVSAFVRDAADGGGEGPLPPSRPLSAARWWTSSRERWTWPPSWAAIA